MSISRAALILPLLLLVAAVRPAPVAAGAFTPAWTLTGWEYVQEVGNTDGDPQKELLFCSRTDRHLALVDGLTGVIEKEFPDFTADNTSFNATDVDQDGRRELFFWRPSPPLVTGYDWNGGTYVTLFSHTDPVDQQWGLAIFRNGTYDALEVSSNDVRIRSLSGTVLFRASTQVPGWTGTGVNVFVQDDDQDGIQELGVIQNLFSPSVKTDFFRYTVGFSPMWSLAGWQPLGAAKTNDDNALEIIMVAVDGHYALFDGMSGGLEKEFPGFSIFQGASLSTFNSDGDAPDEVFLWRPEELPTTRQFVSYDQNGSTYVQKFSHSDRVDGWSLGYFRSASQYDFLETFGPTGTPTDFRIRDLNGNVIFTASAGIPGWTGGTMFEMEIDSDQDGIRELAVEDGNILRYIHWSGSAFTQVWSTAAWSLQAVLDNVDGDPQPEMIVTSNSDHHFALMNPANGAIEHEFPAFNSDTSFLNPIDLDGDGRLELLFSPLGGGSTLSTAYDWTPSGWVTLFSHNEAIEGYGSGHFRTAGTTELAELASADLRVRDVTGAVLFRASVNLPGWTGTNRDMQAIDVDGDGIQEFVAIDAGHVWLVHYLASTAVMDPNGRGDFQVSSAPNPFRTGTAFRISTTAPGRVEIRVVDASGRLVRRIDEHRIAGMHEIHWDGKDEQGRSVPAGILFYEVTANGARKTGRMVRLGR